MKYITSAERIGIQKGMQQGMQQGMEKGERAILLRLLERKFGSLPACYQQRIEKADADELLEWVDIAVFADSLNEIFKSE